VRPRRAGRGPLRRLVGPVPTHCDFPCCPSGVREHRTLPGKDRSGSTSITTSTSLLTWCH
jgi:hypothetical protein